MKIVTRLVPLESKGGRPDFLLVTEEVRRVLEESCVKNGFCVVYSHHTTCSVMIQECSFDTTYTGLEYLQQDLLDVFENTIPTCRREGQYMHPGPKLTQFSIEHGEAMPETLNTDAHLRSGLIGRSACIPILDGELDLGPFGQIYFVDFDQTRSRKRTLTVQVVGE